MQEGSKVKVYVNVLPSHMTNQTSNVAFHSGLQINILPLAGSERWAMLRVRFSPENVSCTAIFVTNKIIHICNLLYKSSVV